MFENVLVTGGAGRLGRHVCRRLASKRKVTSLDLAAPENDPFLAGAYCIVGDITD